MARSLSLPAALSARISRRRDITFVRGLCDDLGYTLHGRLALAVDNTACIDVANNMGVTARNKHYEREIHYYRQEVHLRRITSKYISTKHQTADIFTKNLDATTFLRHRNQLLCGKELDHHS